MCIMFVGEKREREEHGRESMIAKNVRLVANPTLYTGDGEKSKCRI